MGDSSSGDGADPEKIFQLNEKKQFKVLDIDADNRKIALSLKDAK
jgi:ribosomal protein S1